MEEMDVLDWAVANPSRSTNSKEYMVIVVQDFDSDLMDQRTAIDLLEYVAAPLYILMGTIFYLEWKLWRSCSRLTALVWSALHNDVGRGARLEVFPIDISVIHFGQTFRVDILPCSSIE